MILNGLVNIKHISTIDKMIYLFLSCREDFGGDDPDSIKGQEFFEKEFLKLICKHRGHDIGTDHCGIPEHDYCTCCGKLRIDIEKNEVKK